MKMPHPLIVSMLIHAALGLLCGVVLGVAIRVLV